MKISQFDYGSISFKNTTLNLVLDDRHSLPYDQESDLKNATDNYEHTIPIKEIESDSNRTILKKEIPEGFLNVHQIRKESLPIRISVIYNVIKFNPLEQSVLYSIHPSTILFMPMKKVLFAYTDTEKSPQLTKQEILVKYKAFALSLITGLPYERFLAYGEKTYQLANKGGKKFYQPFEKKEIKKVVNVINEAQSIEELTNDLYEIKEYEQFQYFREVNKVNKTKNFQRKLLIGISVAVVLVIVLSMQLLNSSQNSALAQKYDEQLEQKNSELQVMTAANNNNYDKAKKILEKQGVDDQERINWLVEEKAYQSALDENPNEETIQNIVSTLYKNDNQEKIQDLNYSDSQILKDEKAIISYDQEYLSSRATLVDNKQTAEHMAQAFADNDNTSGLQTLNQRFNDLNLDNQIAITEKEKEINSLKSDIENLEDNEDDNEDDINSKKDEIEQLEKEIEDMK